MSILRLVPAALALTLAALTLPARAHDVSCAETGVLGGEWTQIANQPTGDRTQPAERFIDAQLAMTLAPAWTFDADLWSRQPNNEITGYPIVSQGCVYVGSSLGTFAPEGWLFAINADTGELVWRTKTKGGVYSTVAVEDGVVYAFVSRVSDPYVVALDQFTGRVLWERTVDHQKGSDAVSSPVVYDGMVWVGISGTAAEIEEEFRPDFQGHFSLLDADTGEWMRTYDGGIARTYTIPPEVWHEGFAGGAIWSTMAVDPETSFGYVGTGNPFDYDNEYPTTNSILKIDLARARVDGVAVSSATATNPDFAQIVDSYKGNIEEYVPEAADIFPCEEIEQLTGIFGFGLECLHFDLDFGAMPNIFRDSEGRKLVGAGQKSGVYHAVDPDTMEVVWTSLLGVPSAVGGIVGSAAVDGSSIYGPHTLGSYLWSVEKDTGALNWIAPVGSGINWGPPVTVANRVAYTVDLSGFLNAYDTGSGLQLLKRPLMLGAETRRTALSWGGVTVARGTVYVSAGVGLTSAGMPSLPTGYVIAFRPQTLPRP